MIRLDREDQVTDTKWKWEVGLQPRSARWLAHGGLDNNLMNGKPRAHAFQITESDYMRKDIDYPRLVDVGSDGMGWDGMGWDSSILRTVAYRVMKSYREPFEMFRVQRNREGKGYR